VRSRPRVAVVGGGIAGLAASYYLEKLARETGPAIECRLFEASESLGGVIRTERREGFLLDTGPDSLFKGKPAAIDLAREIGLGDEILEAGRQELPTLIYSRGRLRPLPAGLEMLSPTRVVPFLLSGLISFPGKARMSMEPFIARKIDGEDESVAQFVRRRFGGEAADKIAGPLFAGIHAGDPERLSIKSTFPRLVEMERRYGSLAAAIGGMRRASAPAAPPVREGPAAPAPPRAGRAGPPFVSFRGGIRRIVEGLQSSLGATRVDLRSPVSRIERSATGYRIHAGGEPWEADACVVAVGAGRAAAMIEGAAPRSAAALRKVRYVSSATVFLGYRARDTGPLPGSTGFLIPFSERRRIFGCTFVSNKFEGRSPDGSVLLRVFVGGAVDERNAEQPEGDLVRMAREEIGALIGLRAEPILTHVASWPKANPQYEIGHQRLIDEVDDEGRRVPGLVITGSGLRGVGIPDGVASGKTAAAQVLAHLRAGIP
jgi:oxygen-dependent protoporphyrinogen oxidase